MKRALKALDSPDPSLSDAEQVNHTRQCLIQIGAHIDRCLRELQHADKVKEWRRCVPLEGEASRRAGWGSRVAKVPSCSRRGGG